MPYEKPQDAPNPAAMEDGESRVFLKLDFRMLSLASFLLGFASIVIISIFCNLQQSMLRKVALGGALSVLEYSRIASLVVAFFTVVTKVQVGTNRLVEILPRGSSGCARVLAIAILMVCVYGALEDQVREKIWEMTEEQIQEMQARHGFGMISMNGTMY